MEEEELSTKCRRPKIKVVMKVTNSRGVRLRAGVRARVCAGGDLNGRGIVGGLESRIATPTHSIKRSNGSDNKHGKLLCQCAECVPRLAVECERELSDACEIRPKKMGRQTLRGIR